MLKNKISLALLSYTAFLISIISIILLKIDIKVKVMAIVLSLIIIFYLNYREKIGQELIVAFLFSLFVVSYFNYNYISANLFLGKINLFPLISWSGGLVLLREIYERINLKFGWKFITSCLIYWFLLFSLEYLFYNFLGVKLSSNYSGFLGINLMHGPSSMKAFYILAGPIYLLITDYLKVK